MPAKRWTELTSEVGHEIQRLRHAFLAEHVNADQIVCSKEGIPLQAIYFTPEMPGYGKTRADVPMIVPPRKDVK